MTCIVKAIITTTIVLSLVDLAQAAPMSTLVLGKKLEGDIGGKSTRIHMLTPQKRNAGMQGYSSEIPVALNSGQSITLSASVVGTGRTVSLILFDPSHKIAIGFTKKEINTAQLTVDEVNASGKYTIVVVSDQVGPFSLRATSSEDEDETALTAKLKELEQQVEETKAKLNSLKKKKSGSQ
jgi:hypothetical protein